MNRLQLWHDGIDVEITYSINQVPIRLTEERWQHIIRNKPYMEAYRDRILESIERPDWILRGYSGALVAVSSLGRHAYLHTVYKESHREDGFVITAFIARDLKRRTVIWP